MKRSDQHSHSLRMETRKIVKEGKHKKMAAIIVKRKTTKTKKLT